jgi:hypothetical protein
MFFISVDIDLLNQLKKRETITNNEINNKTHNETNKKNKLNPQAKLEEDFFRDATLEKEIMMRDSLILSELTPVFILLSFAFSILSRSLFQYSDKLREELVQNINNNPELQRKIEKLVKNITKKWERLNKKLNLVLTKGFVFLYNLTLALLGIEIFVIYFGIIFYIFYIFFKEIKEQFKQIFKPLFKPLFSIYQNKCQYCPCCPYNMSNISCSPEYQCQTQYQCYPNEYDSRDECNLQDDYYMYNEYDDHYDDYYDNGLYN